MPQFLDYSDADFEASFTALLNAKREDSPDVDAVVADIIADVRARGDAAVIDLTERFDRIALTPETLRITPEEAMKGLVDFGRIEEMLARTQGKVDHIALERISPLAAPLMLEAGRFPVQGQSTERLLAEEAERLMMAAGLADL